jgi:crotonobetaine/carnitine-CoA ligase
VTAGADAARTIPVLLATAASRDPGGVWLRSDDLPGGPSGGLTFEAAAARVASLADLLREHGVGRGDLVVLTARTTPDYLLCWLALTCLGAVAVATNPRSAPAELAGLIAQTSPRALITDAGLASLTAGAGLTAGAVLDGRLPVLDAAELARDAGSGHPAGGSARTAALTSGNVSPSDVAAIIPTSGTTGRSKLVQQTHLAYVMAGEGFPFWMELTSADRLMTSLPLFHINAPAYSVMGSLACGAGLILLPRFSAHGFLDSARRHGATEFNAIGAMLEILMRQPERPDDAATPLRLCYTGPAPEKARQEEIEERFGLRIVVGYAMSESPYGLIWPRGTRPYGTLGAVRQHPVLGTVNEARVIGPDGDDLPVGGTGELLMRNPAITPGYWGMPEATAEVITPDGWLHTGDLVTAGPDGMYTFVSRVKEVIRRRGENLSPLEVEEVLAAHPAVLECAVTGVPSELTEEEVKAFVVAAPGAAFSSGSGSTLDFAELHEFAAARLAAFKVPRYWQQVSELPRTPTARVAKHRLPAGHPPGEYDAQRPEVPPP